MGGSGEPSLLRYGASLQSTCIDSRGPRPQAMDLVVLPAFWRSRATLKIFLLELSVLSLGLPMLIEV